jgi:hypothetical protein
MVRLDAGFMTVALSALAVSCGSGSHQPEPPAALPTPTVQPHMTPSPPSTPAPKSDPKTTPKDSTGPRDVRWQAGPIAAR